MKKPLKIVIAVAVLLVLALGAAWLFIDSIAKAGIEHGATYALGVDTRVDSVRLSLLGGKLGLTGLTVSNPEGFKTPHFLKTGTFALALRPGSLFEDTIEIEQFELDGIDLYVEQEIGKSNVSVILDNIAKISGDEKPDEKKTEGGKKVKVDHIVIRNVTAHVQVLPIGGNATTLTVKVPEIVLDNVTDDNAGGVATSTLVQRLVPAIMAAVVDKGKGILPDADLNQLGQDVAKTTQALGAGASQLVHQVGGTAAKAVENLGDATKNVGKNVGNALENLLGGKKKDEAESK